MSFCRFLSFPPLLSTLAAKRIFHYSENSLRFLSLLLPPSSARAKGDGSALHFFLPKGNADCSFFSAGRLLALTERRKCNKRQGTRTMERVRGRTRPCSRSSSLSSLVPFPGKDVFRGYAEHCSDRGVLTNVRRCHN